MPACAVEELLAALQGLHYNAAEWRVIIYPHLGLGTVQDKCFQLRAPACTVMKAGRHSSTSEVGMQRKAKLPCCHCHCMPAQYKCAALRT